MHYAPQNDWERPRQRKYTKEETQFCSKVTELWIGNGQSLFSVHYQDHDLDNLYSAESNEVDMNLQSLKMKRVTYSANSFSAG
jgi:hypothetical protein